ncbi:ERC protein 2 like protein [Argiope bruennichi]|uniref:ERC protein 2 like protein n=1 Tax=Argiope bruennichi TaxID=94029 RepID=A0A8T0FM63_ARGBR|nr:ERC protein 2 like protein [Argiope bruennichi]
MPPRAKGSSSVSQRSPNHPGRDRHPPATAPPPQFTIPPPFPACTRGGASPSRGPPPESSLPIGRRSSNTGTVLSFGKHPLTLPRGPGPTRRCFSPNVGHYKKTKKRLEVDHGRKGHWWSHRASSGADLHSVPLQNFPSRRGTGDREFVPIRDPRDRWGGPPSWEAGGVVWKRTGVQGEYSNLKRELEATTQKLGSSMHSIKTFWSPELKKERALRKEEAAKYALINDQMKILRSENQKQAALIRQLEEELRLAHMRNPDAEVQQHLEALKNEKGNHAQGIFFLGKLLKELELRIETQKQTLAARDESIKKLMEIKGVGGQEDRLEVERLKSKLIETEARYRHLESMYESRDKDLNKDSRIKVLEEEIELLESKISKQHFILINGACENNGNVAVKPNNDTEKKELLSKMEELRIELNRRDQEIVAMNAKMKTLEEQHHDYQRHIAVLKESLCAKEEHYNMLQADVEELRVRLEEKNKLIEKKTQQTMTSSQEKNRLMQEVQELRDHMEIKDRKINVLQRKIENLEDLLKEKDNQVDMARARLTAMQAHHSSSEGALSSLEEAIGDKDKQISQLREQRDRAEQERNEERELHEREIAEYKMKMHALENDMEKLQVRLEKAAAEKDRIEVKLENSQSELGQARAELEKMQSEMMKLQSESDRSRSEFARLALENERMREQSGRLKSDLDRSQTTFGKSSMYQLDDYERLQDRLEKAQTELRRVQAEYRMHQAEQDRARGEVEQLQEKIERSQGEIYRLKAKLENAQADKESIQEEYDRVQSTVARSQSERDAALAEAEKLRAELDRIQNLLTKSQSQHEKTQAALDKAQLETDRIQEKLDKATAEARRMQLERERAQSELENMQTQLSQAQMSTLKFQKGRNTAIEKAEIAGKK